MPSCAQLKMTMYFLVFGFSSASLATPLFRFNKKMFVALTMNKNIQLCTKNKTLIHNQSWLPFRFSFGLWVEFVLYIQLLADALPESLSIFFVVLVRPLYNFLSLESTFESALHFFFIIHEWFFVCLFIEHQQR
jgi:hypothetical protein